MSNTLTIVLLAIMATATTAHLTAVCSSTDPAKAGEIDFYFGTYHTSGEAATGSVTITGEPGGPNAQISASASFSGAVSVPNSPASDLASLDAMIRKAYPALPSNAKIDCYTQNAQSKAMLAPPSGQWMIPVAPGVKSQSGGYEGPWCMQANIKRFNKLTIKGAKTGNFKFTTSGTNAVYDPQNPQNGKQWVCDLSTTNPKWIGGMSVATGEPGCDDAPSGLDASIDPASVAGCKGTIGGAACTTAKCVAAAPSGASVKGSLKCSNGKWDASDDFKCTPMPLPTREKTECDVESEDTEKEVATAVNQAQNMLNNLATGSNCSSAGQTQVVAAQQAAAAATSAVTAAAQAATAALGATVTFAPITYSQLQADPSCASMFQDTSYTAAKALVDKTAQDKIEADAAAKAAAAAVTTATTAAGNEKLACQCKVKADYEAAWARANANNQQHEEAWNRAAHLRCVLEEDVTLDSQGNAQGQCKVDPVPKVTPITLAAGVNSASPCPQQDNTQQMDNMETSLVSMIKVSKENVPANMHRMPNGNLMADDEMSAMHRMADGSWMGE